MSEWKTLKEIRLDKHHKVTGETQHFRDGDRVINIALLKIGFFPGEDGYYLLYCDKEGAEITDTFHNSVEEAMSQAEYEFLVKTNEWKDISQRE